MEAESKEYEVAAYAKTAYWLAAVQSVSTHKLVTRPSFTMLPVSLAEVVHPIVMLCCLVLVW